MKTKIACLLLLCALIFCGCRKLDGGKVIDKRFYPEHRQYLVHGFYHVPDQWWLLILDEEHKEWWEVSEDIYNSVNVGDTITREDVE